MQEDHACDAHYSPAEVLLGLHGLVQSMEHQLVVPISFSCWCVWVFSVLGCVRLYCLQVNIEVFDLLTDC